MRIALVSDSHLAPIAEAFDANWQAVRDYIAQSAIDLTIHLGDITLDGFVDPNQHDHARRMSADWPSPLLRALSRVAQVTIRISSFPLPSGRGTG
jgi:hypothetical protein